MNAGVESKTLSSHVVPAVPSGYGSIYPLLSPEFVLAVQTQKGELHVHHKTREVYVCVAGEGILEYSTDTWCSLKTGDIFDIEPGMPHALSVDPGKSVSVLVFSFPRFTLEDYHPLSENNKQKKEIEPNFYLAHTLFCPDHKIIFVDADFTITQMAINKKWKASSQQDIFVVSGSGVLHTKNTTVIVDTLSAFIMQEGDALEENSAGGLKVIALKKH